MPGVTYGRLDEVLRGLGFSVRVTDDDGPPTRVYRRPDSKAIILLPTFPEKEPVLPRHLVMVRTTLDLFGILEPMDFDARLQKVS